MLPSNRRRQIAVFMASPGDLATERRLFRQAVETLNEGFGEGANIRFEALGWEDTLSTVGRRTQAVINREIDRCDVFILVLHRRWGQKATDSAFSSYTEEEFHRALERWRATRAPEIFVFFKRVDPASEADPGPQLEKVMEFRTALEESKEALYRYIEDDGQSFLLELNKHLRAYARGELPQSDPRSDLPILPLTALTAVKEAKAEAEAATRRARLAHEDVEVERARALELSLQLAEDAAEAALEGKIERARQRFARVTAGTTNSHILSLAFEFYYRTGDIGAAESLARRRLESSVPDSEDRAASYRSLGLLHQLRGDLDEAESMYRRSLTIYSLLDLAEGMANQHGNLANILRIRGRLEQAEHNYSQSLQLYEKIGSKAGMAKQLGNLGIVYRIRGNLDAAKAMYEQSLELNKALNRKEGMAKQYGNLGIIHQILGDLDVAEQMYRLSLGLSEELGRKEGMANQYGNLGDVYRLRGSLDAAEAMYRRSLALEEQLGRKEGMANDYGDIGLVCELRGQNDEARAMYSRALALSEELGHKEGTAKQHRNLGNLELKCGGSTAARRALERALHLYEELGSDQAMLIQEQLRQIPP